MFVDLCAYFRFVSRRSHATATHSFLACSYSVECSNSSSSSSRRIGLSTTRLLLLTSKIVIKQTPAITYLPMRCMTEHTPNRYTNPILTLTLTQRDCPQI